MDFIGRYENLTQDFEYVCKKLNLSDSSLPHQTKVGTPLYISAYDDKSIDLVSKKFKEEIQMFQFKFGQQNEFEGQGFD